MRRRCHRDGGMLGRASAAELMEGILLDGVQGGGIGHCTGKIVSCCVLFVVGWVGGEWSHAGEGRGHISMLWSR